MELWHIFSIIAVLAVILEIVVPSGFFMNFTLAGIITALISLKVTSLSILVLDFVILSALSIWLIRPLLLRGTPSSKTGTGLNDKYIGKVTKVVDTVTKYSGSITIYDERWDARIEQGEDIPAGSEVKIIRNEGLILFVEKI